MPKLIEIAVGPDRHAGNVVFVHGLGGDAINTWGGKTKDDPNFWPNWIAEALPDIAVYSLAYDAAPTQWQGEAMPLLDRGRNVLTKLTNNEALLKAPLAFICHSLGGLVVKQVLRNAVDDRNSQPDAAALLDNIAQVIFLATPHNGAGLVAVAEALSLLARPTVAMLDLKRNNALLRDLNVWYRNIGLDHGIQIKHLVFFENEATNGALIVDPGSADPGISGAKPISIDANHVDICKPEDRTNDVHETTLKLLKTLPQARDLHQVAVPATIEAMHTPIIHPEIRAFKGYTERDATDDTGAVPAEAEPAPLIDVLDRKLWAGSHTVAIRNSNETTLALHGMGGVGKTVLAQQYAFENRARYQGVWWLRAQTRETLIDDLVVLGKKIDPGLAGLEPEDIAIETLNQIAQRKTDKPWLMIYDNVDDPALIRKLTPADNAHTLITTRLTEWHGDADELPVNVFDRETAIEFLLKQARNKADASESAGRLADALDCLPLALGHARSYCWGRNWSFDRYIEKLPELIDECPKNAKYPKSVFATFNLAIEQAAFECEEAEQVMALLAFFAADQVPQWLIPEDLIPEPKLSDAIAALNAVSLVAHENMPNGAPALSAHRLVQEVMRARLRKNSLYDEVVEHATRLIATSYDDRIAVDAFEKNLQILAHAMEIVRYAPKTGPAAWHTLWVYIQTGDFHSMRGATGAALEAFRASMTIRKGLAAGDPANAGWQADLAASHGKTGQLFLKMAQVEQALDMFVKGRTIIEPLAVRSENVLWQKYIESFDADIQRAKETTSQPPKQRRSKNWLSRFFGS